MIKSVGKNSTSSQICGLVPWLANAINGLHSIPPTRVTQCIGTQAHLHRCQDHDDDDAGDDDDHDDNDHDDDAYDDDDHEHDDDDHHHHDDDDHDDDNTDQVQQSVLDATLALTMKEVDVDA